MGKTALAGGMLIDGSGGEPILNSLVLVEDKKIVYAGAAKPYAPITRRGISPAKPSCPASWIRICIFPAT